MPTNTMRASPPPPTRHDHLEKWSHVISPFHARRADRGGTEILMGGTYIALVSSEGEVVFPSEVPENARGAITGLIDSLRVSDREGQAAARERMSGELRKMRALVRPTEVTVTGDDLSVVAGTIGALFPHVSTSDNGPETLFVMNDPAGDGRLALWSASGEGGDEAEFWGGEVPADEARDMVSWLLPGSRANLDKACARVDGLVNAPLGGGLLDGEAVLALIHGAWSDEDFCWTTKTRAGNVDIRRGDTAGRLLMLLDGVRIAVISPVADEDGLGVRFISITSGVPEGGAETLLREALRGREDADGVVEKFSSDDAELLESYLASV